MDKLEFGRNKQLLTFLIQESKLKLKKTSLDSDTKTRVETNLQLLIQERELLIKNYNECQTALLQSYIENSDIKNFNCFKSANKLDETESCIYKWLNYISSSSAIFISYVMGDFKSIFKISCFFKKVTSITCLYPLTSFS